MITATLSDRLRGSLAKWERRMIARADAVIVPDLHRREQFGATRPKRLVEILNVPEDRPVPKAREDPDRFIVFYGGMLARDRGLRDLVIACEAVRARLAVAEH